MIRKFLTIFLALVCSGCATNYFPLKNQNYFIQSESLKRKIFIMPYNVEIYTMLDTINTREKFEEKVKSAKTYILEALKTQLIEREFEFVGHVPLDDLNTDKIDEDLSLFIEDTDEEFTSAVYSIRENLNKEKGKEFDYSLGLRAKELSEKLPQQPDFLLFIYAGGWVMNLSCLETNVWTTAEVIITLGMSKLVPCPDDTINLEVTLVDSKTGDMIFIDTFGLPGRSFLINKHVEATVKQVFKNFPKRVVYEK